MQRTPASAQLLSETFAARMRDIYPTLHFDGLKVVSTGDGRWEPQLHLELLPDPVLAEAYAIASDMQTEFDLVSGC